MGNGGSTKQVNKQKVSLSVRNFAIQSLPNKPSVWNARIDAAMWQEFIATCRDAATLPDAEERKAEYKKYQCHFWLGMFLVFAGMGLGCGLGIPGGINDNTVMWVFAILLGGGSVVGGLILFVRGFTKFGEIAKQYISDVRFNLSAKLVALNSKYNGIITFNTKGTGNNIFKDKENADTTINIRIEIILHVDHVHYIPDQQRMS